MGWFGVQSSSILVAVSMIFSWMYLANTAVNVDGKTSRSKMLKMGKCDIYEGRWVVDETYPVYNSSSCPYIRKEFNCQKYGRPDQLYLKYRWQPKDCDLPRFDGEYLLRRFKGKKIMYIGDSVSLNHWQSMVCLLHAAVPDQSRILQETNDTISTFIFQDYHDLSVMLFHSQYLVDIENEQNSRILKLDSLKNGETWKKIDVLVFNTWLWWYRRGPKQPWDYIQDGHNILKDMDRMLAFRKGLLTWAKWVDSEVDLRKTLVFFQATSPSHYIGEEWGKPGVRNCSKETRPISGSTYPAGLPSASHVLEEVLSSMIKPIHLLNITTLSQLRKDGHPSMYNAFRGMDCTHWCVPGLVDTWNQLLYTTLIS